jgi:hypothetical protein
VVGAAAAARANRTAGLFLPLGLLGVALLLICPLYGYAAASASVMIRILMALGGVLATLLLPIPPARERDGRVAAAAIAFVVLLALNPANGAATSGASGQLQSRDVSASAAAVKKLLAAGQANLVNAQLRHADLSNLDFTGARLDFANLITANLSGSNLTGASVEETWFDGANLEGAKLEGLVSAEKSHCNNITKMPTGWACTAGHLAPDDSPAPAPAPAPAPDPAPAADPAPPAAP